jgi:hypothetical protein
MNASLPFLFGIAAGLMLTTTALHAAVLDTNRIEQITGLRGAWNADEGVFKISQARTDVPVKVDEWTVTLLVRRPSFSPC